MIGGSAVKNEGTALSFARILTEGIKEMVMVIRVNGVASFTYEFLNSAAMEKTILNPASIGKTIDEVHTPEIAFFLKERYAKVVKTKESAHYEDFYYSSENALVYTKSSLTPLYGDNGTCTHIVSHTTDITNEKMTKKKKQASHDYLVENFTRSQSLFDNNTDIIVTVDTDGFITGGNSVSSRYSGYSINDLVGKDMFDFVVVKDRKLAKEHFNLSVAREMKDQRAHLINKSGNVIACLVKFVRITTDHDVLGYYVVAKDMTELDKRAEFYKVEKENYQIIAENVHDVIMLVGQFKECLYISPSAETIFGFPVNADFKGTFFDRIHSEDRAVVSSIFEWTTQKCIRSQSQFRLLHEEKSWIWIEVSGTPVLAEDGSLKHMVIIARDISIQKEYENRLKHFAYFDALTELPNRRYFQEYANDRLEQSQDIAIMILDIDDFKEINDLWGHEIGDSVIQEFGHRLTGCVQGENIVARLGGDEFILLLTNVTSDKRVKEMANAIYLAMETPINVQHLSFDLSISIGSALGSAEKTTISAMMKRADLAMYQAKQKEKTLFT